MQSAPLRATSIVESVYNIPSRVVGRVQRLWCSL